MTLDDLYQHFYAASCKVSVACGSTPDVSTCRPSVQFLQDTEYQTLKADVASGKVHYDASKAGACLQVFDELGEIYAGGCKYSSARAVTAGLMCEAVFAGTVPEGGACFTAAECISTRCDQTDSTCSRSRQCCAGTCAPKPIALTVGADCIQGSRDQLCPSGASCLTVPPSQSPKCTMLSNVQGTSCSSQVPCGAPLFCDLPSATGSGTCQPTAVTGAPCNPVASYGACDDLRDYCDRNTHVCTRKGAPGDPCDPAQRNCLAYAQCLGSVCVSLSPERGACDPTNGPGCLPGLQCSTITNTCSFPATEGACM